MTITTKDLYYRLVADARGLARAGVFPYEKLDSVEKRELEIAALGIATHYRNMYTMTSQTVVQQSVFEIVGVPISSDDERNAWELIKAAWTVWTDSADLEEKNSAMPLFSSADQRDGWVAVWRRAKHMLGTVKAGGEKGLTGDWDKDKPDGPIDLLEITKGLVGRRR